MSRHFHFLVLFEISFVLAASHNIFKNCERVPFCANFRSRIIDPVQQFFADTSALLFINNTVIIPLYNAQNDTFTLNVQFCSDYIIRVKILEEPHTRFELSQVLIDEPARQSSFSYRVETDTMTFFDESDEQDYKVIIVRGPPFLVAFYYKDDLKVLLNGERFAMENTETSQAFSFSVDFEEVRELYGLFHHSTTQLELGQTAEGFSDPFRLRNSDNPKYKVDSPKGLYGSVPVIYGHSPNGTSGVFFHNAAEHWVDINYNRTRPSAFFMAESGTFDLFVFIGPTFRDVVRQYTSITGKAHLPQLWALGYHQSRFTYETQDEVIEIISQMAAHDFPIDAIWLDDGYTDGNRYFQWNPANFSNPIGMQNIISSTKKKIVVIADPHIKVDDSYIVYAGAKSSFFVKWANGSNYEGLSLPGLSSWIDFMNPRASIFYASWYAFDKFKGSTETVAGVWNDMNEPSVFDDSSERTLPFETVHYGNVLHRDVHNIYGLLHVQSTHAGLMRRDNGQKRPFILTRSYFAGSQRYAAIWTGHNTADWPYLATSFAECMTANLVGIVFCGADIGGFFGDPDTELLQRWYQAAVWLPFFRSHSNKDTARREPYLFSENVQNVIRTAIKLRYKHIPVWYTLFYEHTRYGDPIVRPITYDYPDYVPEEFHMLVGSDIFVRPVMAPNQSQVMVTFPGGEDTYWYRADNGSWVVHIGDTIEELDVDITSSPLFYKGGSIIIVKDTERQSTTDMLNDHYTLHINLNQTDFAEGRLYLDDFTSFDYRDIDEFFYVQLMYRVSTNEISMRQLDGNINGVGVVIQAIILHRNVEKDSTDASEVIYTTTSDGTPLTSIDFAQQLNTRSKDFTIKL